MVRVVLVICTICVFFCGCMQSDANEKEKLKALKKEIKELEARAEQYRAHSFSEVMDAQKKMMTEWKGFANDIKEAEEFEERAQILEKKIEQLKNEVKELQSKEQPE